MSKSTKKIKEPVKKGVAKVPVIMQMEALECGAACLTMVLAYYEKWVPLEKKCRRSWSTRLFPASYTGTSTTL